MGKYANISVSGGKLYLCGYKVGINPTQLQITSVYALMASLTRMDLLDKVFIYSGVAASQSAALSMPFVTTKPLYILISIRALAGRYREVNDVAIVLFMRANKHTISWKDLFKNLDVLLLHGYIIRSGKNDQRIYLTLAGIAALNELESTFRRSHFKFRRADSHTINLPGPKPGRKIK